MSDSQSDAPRPIYNWMSGIGAGLLAVGVAGGAFQLLIEWIARGGSGYAGLALLPAVALIGIGAALVVAGWLRERRRQRRGERSSFYDTVVLDPFSLVRERGLWLPPLVIAGAVLVFLAFGTGTAGVVEVSESNEFCTQACHSVMGPEAVAYQDTAHSRIPCVECHVGAGPEGFFAAKLGGLRQVYALATDTVTRPIPTPIHGSPIDRELCESCHAPERDAGIETSQKTYFLSGEDLYPVRVAMAVKVGGGDGEWRPGHGVHYHMQIARSVEFIARDPARQEIAWLRVTDAEGRQRVYESDSDPLDEEERAKLPVRTMECIDCHSRPAHRFASAVESVNRALETGTLPGGLPSIKVASVQALDAGHASTPEALEGIAERLRGFYEEEYPEVLEEQSEELEASIAALRAIYQRTIFPEMKADWRAHPDESNHLESPGCFRCHNDDLMDADGESVTAECTACHSIIAQDGQAIESAQAFDVGQPFEHPEDWSTFEDFSLCSDCHTGGAELYE